MSNKHIVICDLDGTLADGRWRLHLMPKLEQRGIDGAWAEFNLAGIDDLPFQDTIDVINTLALSYEIYIVTGRGEIARDITEDWLEANHVPYDRLIMRPIGDCRFDVDFKRAVLEDIGLDDIVCAFDDLPHMVDFMRSLGLTVYEVTRYHPEDGYVHANKRDGIPLGEIK